MVGVAAHRQSGDCLSPDAERGQVCDDGFQHFAQPDLLFTLHEALIVTEQTFESSILDIIERLVMAESTPSREL